VTRPTVAGSGSGEALSAGFESAAAAAARVVCAERRARTRQDNLSGLPRRRRPTAACVVARWRCSERLPGAEASCPSSSAGQPAPGRRGAGRPKVMKLLGPHWYVQAAPGGGRPVSARCWRMQGGFRRSGGGGGRRKRDWAYSWTSCRRPALPWWRSWTITSRGRSRVSICWPTCEKVRGGLLLLVRTSDPSDLLRASTPSGRSAGAAWAGSSAARVPWPCLSSNDLDRYPGAVGCLASVFPEEFAAVSARRPRATRCSWSGLLRVPCGDAGGRPGPRPLGLARAVPRPGARAAGSVRQQIRAQYRQLREPTAAAAGGSVQGRSWTLGVARVLGQEAADVEDGWTLLDRVHVLSAELGGPVWRSASLTVGPLAVGQSSVLPCSLVRWAGPSLGFGGCLFRSGSLCFWWTLFGAVD